MAIDIGAEAIDRGSVTSVSLLEKSNPANASGTITTVKIYTTTAGTSARKVGTFFLVTGTTYECRDSEDVGVLSVGLNTKTVNLTVVTGDLIGITQVSDGDIDIDATGGTAILHTGNQTDICVVSLQTEFTEVAGYIASLYGEGTETPAGWTNIAKVSGVASASIAKISGVAVASIAKVNGVAV